MTTSPLRFKFLDTAEAAQTLQHLYAQDGSQQYAELQAFYRAISHLYAELFTAYTGRVYNKRENLSFDFTVKSFDLIELGLVACPINPQNKKYILQSLDTVADDDIEKFLQHIRKLVGFSDVIWTDEVNMFPVRKLCFTDPVAFIDMCESFFGELGIMDLDAAGALQTRIPNLSDEYMFRAAFRSIVQASADNKTAEQVEEWQMKFMPTRPYASHSAALAHAAWAGKNTRTLPESFARLRHWGTRLYHPPALASPQQTEPFVH